MESKLLTILSPKLPRIIKFVMIWLIGLPEYSEMARHYITDPLIDGIMIFLISVNQFLEKIHQNLALAANVHSEFGG